MQAIATGAQSIALGDAAIVLAGGIESMSRMPYLVDAEDARWGHKMGNFTLVDAMYRDGFTCSVCGMIMGETVEGLAREYGITREASDAFALESQQRAERAMAEGRFRDELAPVAYTDARGKSQTLSADEHPRAGTTIENLRKLPAVFGDVEGAAGIVTAGSSSGITDGGAAVVIASAAEAGARGLTPLAKIVGWASAGVDPKRMGIGPVPAVHKLLDKTGLRLSDFDLVELNEAFAPQVLAVLKGWGWNDLDRLNVNGSGISLGHPIGATGGRILANLVRELKRRGGRYGVETMCIGGGQGLAAVFERA
jgi:acetyl-CoA C-acetyltransferase